MPFEVSGMDEMLENFSRLGKDIEIAKKKAIVKGAQILRSAMSEKCERSTDQGKHVADNIVVGNVIEGKDDVLVGPIKSNDEFFYAVYLEFGTTKMAAKPFMEPAAIEKKEEVLNKMASVVWGELNV